MSTLPLAADLRRQARAKARVRRWPDGPGAAYWVWSHDCGDETTTSWADDWAIVVGDAVRHVKRCC